MLELGKNPVKTQSSRDGPHCLGRQVFSRVAARRRGHVTVFYCGPPAMGRVISAKCKQFGFGFSKELS